MASKSAQNVTNSTEERLLQKQARYIPVIIMGYDVKYMANSAVFLMTDLTSAFLNATLGRYQIQERLGAGGMARVYKAWDTNLDRPVAIKILHEHLADDSTFKERFEREAKFVGSFNHPNIVRVYDFNSIERDGQSVFYMVMPFIPGKTLGDVLEDLTEKHEHMSRERVLEIMLDITDALGYAHERGMVHRDVKPGNILFDERDQAVLTDFGIARLVQNSNLTGEGITVGTPAYMSPEQAAGRPVDARSDLYSLGAILYEMLAGKPPFEDDGSLSVLLKHLTAPVPPVSQFLHVEDPSLDAVVLRALAKNPDDRYQTAAEFAEDLKAAFVGKSVVPPPVETTRFAVLPDLQSELQAGRTPAAAPKLRNAPLGIFAVGMAVIALLLVVGILSQRTTTNISSPTAPGGRVDSMTGNLFFLSTFAVDDPYNTYWPQSDTGAMLRQITPDGVYRLLNRQPGTAVTSLFDTNYTYDNATITMEAALSPASSPTSGYGIVFRYVDEDHYNVFAVDGAGRFSIWVRKDGQWRELRGAADQWTESSTVHPVGEMNRLTITVNGSHLTGYVNDIEVVSLEDDTLSTGNIGIYLATPRQGEADLSVNLYQVTENSGVESMTADTEKTRVPSMVGDE